MLVSRLLFVIFSVVSFSTSAQSDLDSVKVKPKLATIYLYWDYGKTALLWTDFEKKTEVGVDLRILDKIQFICEYGNADLKPREAFQNVKYDVEGSYWRLGAGLIGEIDPLNKIGLGLRYGQSIANDRAEYFIQTNPGNSGNISGILTRQNIKAHWMEIVLDSEKKLQLYKKNPDALINDRFVLGVNVRYRIMIDYAEQENIDIYTIPGYGRASGDRILAVNLFLKVRIL